MSLDKLRRIDETKIEVPLDYKQGMRVPGIIYLDALLEKDLELQSVEQVANVACLPGIVKASIAMPDVHTGYGFTIGGVAAFDLHEGIVSPGGVGYDINCGVRLLRSNLMKQDVVPKLKDLVAVMYNDIPSGVGSKGRIRLGPDDEKKVLLKGAKWAIENGIGEASDLEKIESGGCLEGADPSIISRRAYERGRSQQGTLGAGNHFLEVQFVDEVFDEKAA